MNEEQKGGIKVNDTRHHATPNQTEEQPTSGEGFTMKADDGLPEHSPLELDFSTLVFSFAQNAFVGLGLTPDPRTQKTEKDLEMAKQNIDVLGVLEEKTKGNLSQEEEALLKGVLVDLRLKYVESSKTEPEKKN